MSPTKQVSRRDFLTLLAGSAATAVAARAASRPNKAAAETPSHANAVWVWRFQEDGKDPEAVRSVLAQHGFDVILKTADADSWMGSLRDPLGIIGGEDVRRWADFFESAGVGFHTWCVVSGVDPLREAEMTAEALANGARSMYFDLESPEGRNYWQRGTEAAVVFGQEVRRLQPNALLRVAPDARPWKIKEVPLAEFCSFCDEVAPQLYWETFDSPANYKLLADYGFSVGPEGVTPELILDAANQALSHFGLPVRPIGQGAAGLEGWGRFINHAYGLGMPSVSVWRYGTSGQGLWSRLQTMPPPQPAPAAVAAVAPAPEPPAAPPASTPAPAPVASSEPEGKRPAAKASQKEEARSKPSMDSYRLSTRWRSLGMEGRER